MCLLEILLEVVTDYDPSTLSESRYTARLPAIAESEVSVKNKERLTQDQEKSTVHKSEGDWTNSGSPRQTISGEFEHSDQLETTVDKAERDWTNSRSVGGAFSSESRDSERRAVTRFADKSDFRNFTEDFESNSSSVLSNQMVS